MTKTPKKTVKKTTPTQEEWNEFERAMDKVLKAPPQPKTTKKQAKKEAK